MIDVESLETGAVWELVVPVPWENAESGLVLASRADMERGTIPRLQGWYSGSDDLPPDRWFPYSSFNKTHRAEWGMGEMELYVDEVCIADRCGEQKRIAVPEGAATHFYARGPGIYRGAAKLVFICCSPHTWCGIRNTSLVTVELKTLRVVVQSLGEPGFVECYLERVLHDKADEPGGRTDDWSNSAVELCLGEGGETLFFAAGEPALTLELRWLSDGWRVEGHTEGRQTKGNQGFFLLDLRGRKTY